MTKIENTKIGIIGLGSIGQRHVKELLALGVQKFYALRTNKGAKNVECDLTSHVTDIYATNDFLNLALDGYIISNPTSLHSSTLQLLKNKCNPIFIEKPLFRSSEDFNLFNELETSKIQVGFCLRFSNFFWRIKELLGQNILGDIYHSRLNVGQYLPLWHPYADYRAEYYSKEALGGGALKTLSHELDLAMYLFGLPTKSITKSYKLSNLEIDVDDYSLILNEFGKSHLNRIEFDFLSKNKERKGIIYGENADLHYDFFNKSIKVFNGDGLEIVNENIELNNMYSSQMSAFLKLINNGKTMGSSWKENKVITKIIEDKYEGLI